MAALSSPECPTLETCGKFHVNSHTKKTLYFFLEFSLLVVYLEELTVKSGLTWFIGYQGTESHSSHNMSSQIIYMKEIYT